MSTSQHNATRDLNGIPVNLIKDIVTGVLKDWTGETFGYVWNSDTLAWEKSKQAVLNAIGSEINVNVADIEAILTNGTQRSKITDGTNNAEITVGAATGAKGLRVFIGPTDPISDLPVFVEFSHHQIHEGEAHMACYLIASLGLNANFNFRINVPTSIYPHTVIEVISTSEAELFLYEGMTFTAGNGGTQVATNNHNRNSSIIPGTTIYQNATPATTGTEIWCGLVGSGNRAGSGDRGLNEFILKANTNYLYRVTSRVASNKILVRFNFYEDLGV